jgi:HSP20 family protein
MANLTKKRSNGSGSVLPDLLDDFFGHRFFSPSVNDFSSNVWNRNVTVPPANITETEKEFVLELSAPGLKKDDFKIEIDNNILTISSEKKEETKEDKDNYMRREFSYSSFKRSFQLPDTVQDEKINAKYDNGLLKVSIPKSEDNGNANRKTIKID